MTRRSIGVLVRASLRPLVIILPLSLLLIGTHPHRIPPATVPSSATSTHTATLPASLAPVAAAALAADDDSYAPHPTESSDATLTARNAAQRFTTVFTPAGLCLTSDETATSWEMHLAAIGSGDLLVPVSLTLPVMHGGRVEYQRGRLTEWYVNSPLGVEQGVTLTTRPADPGTGEVTLVMALDGAVTPTMGESGVMLTGAAGSSLRYGQMTVTDATGRALPARMTVENATIRLIVDDRGAVYPMVVDPLVQQQELTISDSNTFLDAAALSADGNTALIGAHRKQINSNAEQGAAYIFVRSGGTWTQQTTPPLTASDGAAGDAFGVAGALSADGNTALIGAYERANIRGAAYVYMRSGETWSQQTTPSLLASDGSALNRFGRPVALSADGNTALIGALNKGGGIGAAYIFAPGISHLTAPATAPAGALLSPLILTITDPTSGLPIFYTGAVHFSSSDPRATLPADYTFTTADHGTHTFTAMLKTAGNQTITVTAGPAASLVVNPGTTPQNASVGSAFTIPLTVTAADTFGNPVSGVIVTFTAPSSGSSGTFLGGTTSATAATNASGIAIAPTFFANNTQGSYLVAATVNGLTTTLALTNIALPQPQSKPGAVPSGNVPSVGSRAGSAATGSVVPPPTNR